MNKIIKIVLIAVGLIGAVLWFMLPSGELAEGNPAEAAQSGPMSAMFWITFILLAFAAGASLVFALKNIVSNPAGLKKTLFAIVGFVIVAIIAYVLSSGTDVSDQYAAMTDEGTVKKIGMGLYLFFMLLVAAILLMIVPSFKKMLGK